ncbi:TPA: hypothetical protein P5S08_004883 [Salmonella enterica subsp. enterica serovar Concord]|nr:hypothetical protein [Salmonella enterica subsp. enterica serovar Concord]
MAKSNSERQRDYRKNKYTRGIQGDSRINTFVTFEAGFNLAHLAAYYDLTKRQVLELLINTASQKLIDSMETNSPEWNKYFNIE